MFSIKTLRKYHIKIIGLVLLILMFTLFYLLLNDTHFQGINPLQDKIKDAIVEKEANEPFQSIEKQQVKQDIEQVVKEDERKIEQPRLIQRFFDRIYFSTITACLLGYGDIYPATNTMKFLTALQSFCTVCLILY
jgi:hypothetical protein